MLRLLRESNQPLAADAIFEAGRDEPVPLSYSLLRDRIWSLVGRGLIQLTRDWRVSLT